MPLRRCFCLRDEPQLEKHVTNISVTVCILKHNDTLVNHYHQVCVFLCRYAASLVMVVVGSGNKQSLHIFSFTKYLVTISYETCLYKCYEQVVVIKYNWLLYLFSFLQNLDKKSSWYSICIIYAIHSRYTCIQLNLFHVCNRILPQIAWVVHSL